MVKKKNNGVKANKTQPGFLAKMASGKTRNGQVMRFPRSARAGLAPGRYPGLGDAAARYAMALIHPFAKEAEGVRVPEPYAVATMSRKVHVPLTLTTTAGGGVDLVVQPHLVNSFWNTLGTMSGGAGVVNPGNLPSPWSCRSAVTYAALENIFQTYRIVAIGVRIKTNVDFTKSGGRVYAAIMPAGQEVAAAFNTSVNSADVFRCLEVPTDGTNVSAAIVGLPRGFQFSVSELMSEGGAEIHFPITAARALDFLDAQNQSAEQHLVTSTNPQGTLFQASFGLGMYQTAGHSMFVLRGEGLAASTDVFTAEVIYHVEGIPLVGTATLVEAMPHTPAPASPNEIHTAHRIAATVPVVKYVSQTMKELASAREGVRSFVQKAKPYVGAAEKILGVAVRGLELL